MQQFKTKIKKRIIPFLLFSLLSSVAISAERLLPLQVSTNNTKVGVWILLEKDNVLYATKEALDEWRIIFNPDYPSLKYKGEIYYNLSAIEGYSVKINPLSQDAEINFSPNVYLATIIKKAGDENNIVPSPVIPSIFLNYDLNYTGNKLKTGDSNFNQSYGMLGEVGLSNQIGLFTTSFSAIGNQTDGNYNSDRIGFNRLETTFTKNFIDTNQTLRIGDTSTNIAMLGRNVFFGGIQFGTNYNLRPGFVTQPTPLLQGQSASASTVELYINDVLRQTSSIPSGPFTIAPPSFIGNGEARLVVRDQLGRETVITQSFIDNYRLLSEGLSDWVIEGGKIRKDLGVENASYGDFFTAGTYSQGITNDFTVVSRAEISQKLKKGQVGFIKTLPFGSTATAAVAFSDDEFWGTGNQFLLGIEKNTLNSNFFIQYQEATERFRELGQLLDNATIAKQLVANLSYTTNKYGTFSFGVASIKAYENFITKLKTPNNNIDTYTVSYSKPISNNMYLSLIGNKVVGDMDSYYVGLNLTYYLDQKNTINLVSNIRDTNHDLYASYNKTTDESETFGYRAIIGQQESRPHQEIGIYKLGDHAITTLDVSNSNIQSTLRTGLSGAIVFADSSLFATKKINQGFAVIDVPGYENIGVGLGGNITQNHTNKSGKAIITDLTPYQNNQIRLNTTDLPISAEIGSIEEYVVTTPKSASKVLFKVKSGQGALLHVVFEDGKDVPPGAIVNFINDSEDFYVARNGKVFITGLQLDNTLILNYNEKKCQFNVQLKEKIDDEIQKINGIVCKEIKP